MTEDTLEGKLDNIRDEVMDTKRHVQWTNGRVAEVTSRTTELEYIVNGDPRPGRDPRGLIGIVAEAEEVLPTVVKMITAMRWAGITFIGAILVGLANLGLQFLLA